MPAAEIADSWALVLDPLAQLAKEIEALCRALSGEDDDL